MDLFIFRGGFGEVFGTCLGGLGRACWDMFGLCSGICGRFGGRFLFPNRGLGPIRVLIVNQRGGILRNTHTHTHTNCDRARRAKSPAAAVAVSCSLQDSQ